MFGLPISVDKRQCAQATSGVTEAERMRILSLRRLLCTVCCIAICASACSSSTPQAIAYAEDAPSVSEPADGSFSPAEQELISFHATWLCEMQRRTFTSLGDTDVARSAALATENIEPDRYGKFLADDLPRQIVRDAVLWSYQQRCRAE